MLVEGSMTMVTVGLLVRLVAKPGKEAEVTSFLEGGLALVEEEPATIAWFAIRLGPSEFGIFDAFPDDAGRQAHLGGAGGGRADGASARAVGAAAGDRAGRRHRSQAAWLAPAGWEPSATEWDVVGDQRMARRRVCLKMSGPRAVGEARVRAGVRFAFTPQMDRRLPSIVQVSG
jgi:hypothetical protein